MSVAPAPELDAVELYGSELLRVAALPASSSSLRVLDSDGGALTLPLERYVGDSEAEELGVLERAVGPVLDIGCGPARHAIALSARGVGAVGLDISPLAVQLARSRGAVVIHASIFDALPGHGRWGSALLLDGNIGIGGAPGELLRRVAALLLPGGRILVEVEGPGVPTRSLHVSLESEGSRSTPFPWARLGVDGLEPLAAESGLTVEARWRGGRRWFAALTTPEPQRLYRRTLRSSAVPAKPCGRPPWASR